MKKIIILILILLIPATTYAQRPLPPMGTDRLELANRLGQMSLPVPIGWRYTTAEFANDNFYGTMNSVAYIEEDGADQVPTQIEMVFRPLLELSVTVDMRLRNPGADYFEKYAAQQSEVQRGVYSEVYELRDGDLRMGMMVYIEEPVTQLFGDGVEVLHLGIAVPLDDEHMAVVVFQGPSEEWVSLMALWAELLTHLEFDGKAVEFENLREVLTEIERPDQLTARFSELTVQQNDGFNELIGLSDFFLLETDTLSVRLPRHPEWTFLEEHDESVVISQSNTLIHAALLEPADDLATVVEDQLGDDLDSDITSFDWDDRPAVIARYENTDVLLGVIILVELNEETWLQLQIGFGDQSTQSALQVWLEFISRIDVNGERLDYQPVLTAFYAVVNSTP